MGGHTVLGAGVVGALARGGGANGLGGGQGDIIALSTGSGGGRDRRDEASGKKGWRRREGKRERGRDGGRDEAEKEV